MTGRDVPPSQDVRLWAQEHTRTPKQTNVGAYINTQEQTHGCQHGVGARGRKSQSLLGCCIYRVCLTAEHLPKEKIKILHVLLGFIQFKGTIFYPFSSGAAFLIIYLKKPL